MSETRTTNILIYLSVFVSSITFFREPFEGYFHYLIFIILFPVFMLRFGMPQRITGILTVLFITGIVQVLLNNNTYALFFKIFVGLLLSASFYYYVMQYYKLDVMKMFRYYLKGAIIVCYIGLIQFVSYLMHFRLGYDYSWLFNKWGVVSSGLGIRVNSIFSEASQCAIVIAPACLIALHNLITRRRSFDLKPLHSYIILATMILTTSSTGYLGLFLIVLVIMINYRRMAYFFAGLLIAIVGGIVLYNNIDEFKTRVDTTIGLWVYKEYTLENINSSAFVLYNNYHIATENFKSNFLFGTGLGSHQVAFDKYTLTNDDEFLDIHFNKADANSMLLRIISELGLLGLIFIVVFIFRFFVIRRTTNENNDRWLVSGAMLVIIMLYLIRQGNYFINGFPFFMWIYYYTKRAPESLEEEEEEEEEGENEEEVAEPRGA